MKDKNLNNTVCFAGPEMKRAGPCVGKVEGCDLWTETSQRKLLGEKWFEAWHEHWLILWRLL